MDANTIFSLLEKFMMQRAGLDPRDYGEGRDGYRAYHAERRDISKDLTRAKAALREARALLPARLPVLVDSFRAFSGRLELNQDGSRLSYTAGQYFPTEYRKAVAAVLETYCADWKRVQQAETPQTFTLRTMADVRAANNAIGGHYFERSTMRFFGSKIESELIAGRYFVTSERMDEKHARLYSVRTAEPSGDIGDVGEFQEHKTRSAALAVIRELVKGETNNAR